MSRNIPDTHSGIFDRRVLVRGLFSGVFALLQKFDFVKFVLLEADEVILRISVDQKLFGLVGLQVPGIGCRGKRELMGVVEKENYF